MKIGNQAKTILKSFSSINDSMRIRNDYLFARPDTTTGCIFILPKDEIQLDEEIGFQSVSKFLSVIDMCDKDKLKLKQEDKRILITDGKKSFKYNTTNTEHIKPRSLVADDLFDSSNDIIAQIILDEEIIKSLKDSINKLGLEEVSLQPDTEGAKIVAINSISNDEFSINVKGAFNIDTSINFPSTDIFNYLFDGIYKVEIRKTLNKNNKEIYIAKFGNESIKDGSLYYYVAMVA